MESSAQSTREHPGSTRRATSAQLLHTLHTFYEACITYVVVYTFIILLSLLHAVTFSPKDKSLRDRHIPFLFSESSISGAHTSPRLESPPPLRPLRLSEESENQPFSLSNSLREHTFKACMIYLVDYTFVILLFLLHTVTFSPEDKSLRDRHIPFLFSEPSTGNAHTPRLESPPPLSPLRLPEESMNQPPSACSALSSLTNTPRELETPTPDDAELEPYAEVVRVRLAYDRDLVERVRAELNEEKERTVDSGPIHAQPHPISPSLEASRPHSILKPAEMVEESLWGDGRPRMGEVAGRDVNHFEKLLPLPDGQILTSTQRNVTHPTAQEMLDCLAEITYSPEECCEPLRENLSSTQFQTPASSHFLEPQEQVVVPVRPLASIRSSQSGDTPSPPGIADVHYTKKASELIAEVLNEDGDTSLETDSFVYNPSVVSSNMSIPSYKTERSINSRKSRYNVLPRRKGADIEQPRSPLVLVWESIDETSVSESESSNESLGTIPITPRVDESIPNLGARPVHWPLKIHGSSVYSLSFVDVASQLERMIDRWASEVLRIAPVPAAALQDAVLTDITDVGESTALFTDVRPMTVQRVLRHAFAHVISEGMINSLVVTNSAEENLALTRIHERILTQDVATAALWRRQTFSIMVDFLPPDIMWLIFEKNMPLLAALLPDSADDLLGTRGVLKAAFEFSCMLRRASVDANTLFRSFVPKLTSTLHPGLVELVESCQLSECDEVDRVGVAVFPGLVEVFSTPPIAQTVVHRAKVICECKLLATGDHLSAPPLPSSP